MNATSHLSLNPQKLLWIALAALTLIATVLRTLSLFLCMDTIGYFQEGALPVILFYVVTGLTALACAALFFLINKGDTPREPTTLTGARFVGAAIAAIALCATALCLIVRVRALPVPTLLALITAAALLCGAVYFALRLTATKPTTVALWGFGAILSFALCLILTYFDRYTQMNAPRKLSFHVCMLLAMLAVLLELRDLLDRPLPRVCVALTAFAAALCTAISLSSLLALASATRQDPFYMFFDVTALGLAAYFGTKCAQYALTPTAPAKEVAQ